ncbi:hypothetical protein BDB00DRAFT_876101 [Zychaea mexicana]|uniref:uncharacterized protein n=1 Tax=Zychaea mexicana TaxID=64656 RepID=UPI0022FDF5DB|nr:uncharacterized protein BDB00DRAFT_876101 [Zychaea mexicana]KAI9489667.1 hypothetical protein BDB00DRAFT_876101 [Zychaea mexicana]
MTKATITDDLSMTTSILQELVGKSRKVDGRLYFRIDIHFPTFIEMHASRETTSMAAQITTCWLRRIPRSRLVTISVSQLFCPDLHPNDESRVESITVLQVVAESLTAAAAKAGIRGPSWSNEEDVWLCQSWLATFTRSSKGTDVSLQEFCLAKALARNKRENNKKAAKSAWKFQYCYNELHEQPKFNNKYVSVTNQSVPEDVKRPICRKKAKEQEKEDGTRKHKLDDDRARLAKAEEEQIKNNRRRIELQEKMDDDEMMREQLDKYWGVELEYWTLKRRRSRLITSTRTVSAFSYLIVVLVTNCKNSLETLNSALMLVLFSISPSSICFSLRIFWLEHCIEIGGRSDSKFNTQF